MKSELIVEAPAPEKYRDRGTLVELKMGNNYAVLLLTRDESQESLDAPCVCVYTEKNDPGGSWWAHGECANAYTKNFPTFKGTLKISN